MSATSRPRSATGTENEPANRRRPTRQRADERELVGVGAHVAEHASTNTWATAGVGTRTGDSASRTATAEHPSPRTTATTTESPGYLAARDLLTFVRFPAAHPVTTTAEARATPLRPPYALKADWLTHKSEHDAVRTNVTDPAAAFEEMRARLGPGTYVLEEMDTRENVVELIIGARQDHSFGPVVLVGAGGIHAELFNDTAVELAPVTRGTARDMLDRLICAPLLSGWRGAPAVDVAALAELIVEVSETIAARPDLAEMELNPVRVGPDGVLAVDALVVPVRSVE